MNARNLSMWKRGSNTTHLQLWAGKLSASRPVPNRCWQMCQFELCAYCGWSAHVFFCLWICAVAALMPHLLASRAKVTQPTRRWFVSSSMQQTHVKQNTTDKLQKLDDESAALASCAKTNKIAMCMLTFWIHLPHATFSGTFQFDSISARLLLVCVQKQRAQG